MRLAHIPASASGSFAMNRHEKWAVLYAMFNGLNTGARSKTAGSTIRGMDTEFVLRILQAFNKCICIASGLSVFRTRSTTP
jgi:hypothetical protein